MNWIAKGKQAGKPMAYHVVGRSTKEEVIDGLKGTHPEFVAESVETVGAIQAKKPPVIVSQSAAAEVADEKGKQP